MDGTTDAMDVNLGRLQEIERDGRPGLLQSMGPQRVEHDWGTEQQQQQCMCFGGRLLFSFTHKKVKPTLECLSLNPKFPLEGVPWWLR